MADLVVVQTLQPRAVKHGAPALISVKEMVISVTL